MNQSNRSTISLTQKKALQENFNALKKRQDDGATWFIPLVVVFVIFLLQGFKSDRYKNADGYVLIRMKSGNDRYEHRVIAEEILARRLEVGEIVHHINGRRDDNRVSNLCVMDQRDHDRYHEWYEWIVKTYGKYPRRKTQLKKLRESFNGKLLTDL